MNIYSFYHIVEENSVAIFLRKSTEFFGEFVANVIHGTYLLSYQNEQCEEYTNFSFISVIFLLIFCVIHLCLASSMYHFVIGMLAYLSFIHNLSKLQRLLYERDVAQEATSQDKFVSDVISCGMSLINCFNNDDLNIFHRPGASTPELNTKKTHRTMEKRSVSVSMVSQYTLMVLIICKSINCTSKQWKKWA